MAVWVEPKRWAKAQWRPKASGLTIYVSGLELMRIFSGEVPEMMDYHIGKRMGHGNFILELRAREETNGTGAGGRANDPEPEAAVEASGPADDGQ